MTKIISFIFIFYSLTSCTQNKTDLLANDIRLFEGTSAWNLAKAVRDEDTIKIKDIVQSDKVPIDYQEPKFGLTLLTWSAITHRYYSAKTLLQLGADPNKPDNYDGSNSVMEEITWNCYDDDTKFLKLLLDNRANPSYIEQGNRREGNSTRNTPLFEAIKCSFAKTKLLVEAGADINYKNEFNQTALLQAVLYAEKDAAKITRYLLIEKKTDFKNTFLVTINGDTTTFAGLLRNWTFDLNSDDFKIKMEIVNFIKSKQDYWKTSIPKHYYNNYSKEYLDKY